jgi:hypothetical protein
MRIYKAEIRKEGVLVARFCIEAPSRREAVYKASQLFWANYGNYFGQAFRCLVVDDPYFEVHYSEDFNINDRLNKYLPTEVIRRVLLEAGGELRLRDPDGSKYSPHSHFRRFKRRRDFGVFVAPLIKRMKNGRLYYRVITRSQITRNGRKIRKRKYKDVPLESRSLDAARQEITERRLFELNQAQSGRQMKIRDLAVLDALLGRRKDLPERLKRIRRTVRRRYMKNSAVRA